MSKFAEVASACAGKEYGHVPGHQFHDVDVTIGRRGAKFRVEVEESWGSAQGYDEVHGRRRVVAIDEDLDAAVRIASSRAKEAGISSEYLVQALSCAHSDAVETSPDESVVSTDDLVLCRSDMGDGGWSLHAPDATDERIATGDAPVLLDGPAEWDDASGGWNRPNEADYAEAARRLAGAQ